MTHPTPTPPTRPAQVQSAQPTNRATPLSRNKMLAYGQLMVELIIAQVAMALGNIDVLGVHPLAFLTAFGEDLQQKASDAFVKAQQAEDTANTAQGTATAAQGTATAADGKATTALGNWTALFAGIPGVSNITQFISHIGSLGGGLGNIGTNLLSLLGLNVNVDPGTFNPNATSFLVPVEQFVQQFTGSLGDLPELGSWAGNRPSINEFVAAVRGDGGNLLDLSTWANSLTPLATHNQLVDTLGGTFGNSIAAVEAQLAHFLTPASPLPAANLAGVVGDGLLPTLGAIRDALHNIFGGHNVTGASINDVAATLEATNASLVGVSAAAARFNTVLTSGVSAIDLLERTTSSGMGPQWQVGYPQGTAGNVYLDGHNAAWHSPALTAASRTMTARYLGDGASNAAHSATLYQRVEIQLNSVPQNPLIGQPAANDVLLRCNDALTDFIRIRFRGDNVVIISRVVANVEVVMATLSLPAPMASSSSIGGLAGKAGTARWYQPLLNGFPVGDGILESGSASGADSSHQGWGMGMFAGPDTQLIFVPSQSQPGSVKQFSASDQTL